VKRSLTWVARLHLTFGILCSITFSAPQSSSPLSSYELSNPQLVTQGEGVFAQNCAVGYCHGSAGRAGRGPRLRGRDLDKKYLFKVTMEGIPNSSMPGWKNKLTEQEIASVVAYVLTLSRIKSDEQGGPTTSSATLAAPSATTTKPPSSLSQSSTSFTAGKNETVGDMEKGKLLFFDSSNEINCGLCHKIRGVGNDVGPDLSAQKSRSPREILKDILLPSASLTSSRKSLRITTLSGETMTGILLEESLSELKIFDVGVLPAVLRTFPKDQIQSRSAETRSLMPEKYAETYTFRQLLDLITFIKNADGVLSPVRLSDLF
jgi:putative heme-binding domain-containing protein